MVTLATLLAGAALVVAAGTFLLVWQLRATLAATDDDGVDGDALAAAIGSTWREMEFDRTVGQIETHASEMRALHDDIATMLRTPQHRGEFGEQQLELILADHLPPEAFGIRKQVVEGATPDAYLDSSAGRICIDSKFPLENFERAMEAESDAQRGEFEAAFRDDVERQLAKIADEYVRPAAGTADVAFAFVPSEAVYYHLVTEEYDLLREYTGRGVQVVSPLTLGQKLELIKADLHARQLSEEAEQIRTEIATLSERFEAVADEWSVLETHVRNARTKADDVDDAFQRLHAEFDRIEEPGVGEEPAES